MSTKAGTMGFSGRPALFTFWTVTVSVLAAAALILSAVALNVAGRGDRSVTSVEGSGTREAASIGSPLWDAGKLEAMQGRMLAETVQVQGSHRCGTPASSMPCKAECSPRPSGPKGQAPRCGTPASRKPWRAGCSPGSSICSFGRS